jgi:hypothetical protein
MGHSYKLGQIYIDRGKRSSPDDQFLKWINIDGSGMLNSPGIRPLKYLHLNQPVPAYLILVTHEKTGGILNPWEDFVDLTTGTIRYWGDAKYSINTKHDDFSGNKLLSVVNNLILDGVKDLAPPILHFSKPQKGAVKFNGLCIMDKLELTWFEDHGKPVRNFRAILTILDIDEVSIDWLHQRANCKDVKVLNEKSPTIWKEYLSGNTRRLDIWKSEIKPKSQQLPPEGSPDSDILHELTQLSSIQFEALAVAVFRQLKTVAHSITRTRPTSDGGFDFYGHFILPYPLFYKIDFLGEAKKWTRANAVGAKDVSRLVARLARGQYGIFVTTSYYSRQAQKEVLDDGYPVKLLSGIDLIQMMKELHIIQNGQLNRKWLTSVLSSL